MKRYVLSVYYKRTDKYRIRELTQFAIENLGFEPKIMSLLSSKHNLDSNDIAYDKQKVLSFYDNDYNHFVISNAVYHQNIKELYFFRFSINTHDTIHFEWIIKDIEGLIEKGSLIYLTQNEDFIFFTCFDSDDVYKQSITKIDLYKRTFPRKFFRTKKHPFLNKRIVNIKNHYGRKENLYGFDFVAGSKMVFGDNFYSFIPRERLLSFKFAKQICNCIEIDLFDIKELPSKRSNRKKQKEFWRYFRINSLIKEFGKRKNNHKTSYNKTIQEDSVDGVEDLTVDLQRKSPSTTSKEFKDIVNLAFAPKIKTLGFKGSGFKYYREQADYSEIIHFWTPRIGGAIQIGLYVKVNGIKYAPDFKNFKPNRKFEDCEFRKRLSPNNELTWLWLFHENDDENRKVIDNIWALFEKVGLSYFKRFENLNGVISSLKEETYRFDGLEFNKYVGCKDKLDFIYFLFSYWNNLASEEKAKHFAKKGLELRDAGIYAEIYNKYLSNK